MSTRLRARLLNPPREEWNRITAANKAGIHRVLSDIERGSVDSDDLAMLKNFCLFSFQLMKRYGHEAWEEAKTDAEIEEIVQAMKEPRSVRVECINCHTRGYQRDTHEGLCPLCECPCLPIEQIHGEQP